jgi:hypothetical protein
MTLTKAHIVEAIFEQLVLGIQKNISKKYGVKS